MKVEKQKTVDGSGHSVELGAATWDANARSVRNRYATASGGFSPRSSSEVPMADLLPMIELVAENDELSVADCARIIKAVSDSILRQTK